MTVNDAMRLASAQMYGGEASDDDIEDYGSVYLQYAQDGFERIWRKMRPLDAGRLPEAVELECPQIDAEYDLDQWPRQVYQTLADWITYRMFGTNNISKQQRGEWFYARFTDGLGRIRRDANWELTGDGGQRFRNIWNVDGVI